MRQLDRRPDTSTFAFIRVAAAAAIATASVLGVSVAAGPAAAQTACMAHSDVAEQLAARYAEKATAIGVASSGEVIELFSSADGSTWTLVVTKPSGVSCPLAAGESWEPLPIEAPGRKA